jgi:transmembrane sensor
VPGEGESLQGQAIEWLMRLEGEPEGSALRAEFEQWRAQSEGHRRACAAVELVWGTSRQLAPLSTERRESARAVRPWLRFRYGATVIAASALAACIAFFAVPALQIRLQADYVTATAELRELLLEDGSRVALDASSAIAVDYTTAQRGIRLLTGQAFFEVAPSKERPFVVSTGGIEVVVTGTAFNVATSESGVAVAVQSGAVNVLKDDAKKLSSLSAGQRIMVTRSGVRQDTVDPRDVSTWRARYIVVYDVPVREIVEQIGRHVPGMIVFGDARIANSRASGIIDLHNPADALRALIDLQRGRVTTISPYLTVISSP